MRFLQVVSRTVGALGLLAACSCETTAAADAQPSTVPSESSELATTEQGAAGEAALSGEELDRLLDALEQELAAESRKL